MSVVLTCGRCGQWRQEIDAAPDGPLPSCPRCGAAVTAAAPAADVKKERPVAVGGGDLPKQGSGRRNPLSSMGIAAVVVILAAGVAFASWFAWQARDETASLHRRLYDAQMCRIQLAWDENDRDAIPALLDDLRPERTGGTDLRGFEWYLWRHRQPDPIFTLSAPGGASAFSADGSQLAAAGAEGDVTVWDVAGRKEERKIPWKDERPPQRPALKVMIPNGGVLPNAPGAAPVQLKPPPIVQPATTPLLEIRGLVFSPDGKRLVGWSHLGPVHVWDLADGREVFSLKDESPHHGTGGFRAVEYSPDGRTLVYACGGLDGRVGGWDAETGQAKPSIDVKGLTTEVLGQAEKSPPAFSPDRRRIALPLRLRPLEVWDATNGGQLFHVDVVSDFAAFSPDGRRLAGGDSSAQNVIVWDGQTGRRTATLKELASPAVSAAFSPDGRRLVVVSADGVLRAWDLDAASEVLSLKGVASVVFSPNGRFLATAAPDGTIRGWNIGPGD